MKKYLISYGDAGYASQKQFLQESATASAFFDEVKLFSPGDIETDFVNQVGETLLSRKGAGYWLWKPYIVRKVLSDIEQNDILVYCDVSCVINPAGKARFEEYVSMLLSAETGTLDFELPLKESEFTKKEVFDYFNSSGEVLNSNQLLTSVVLLRKCEHTTMLVDEWYEAACDNPFLFTDELLVKQYENFEINHYDQSVFSVIRKEFGANIIPDETRFMDFSADKKAYPFWSAVT